MASPKNPLLHKTSLLTLAAGLLATIAFSTNAENITMSDLAISLHYACPKGWEEHGNRAQFVSGEDVWLDDVPDFAAFIRYLDDTVRTSAGDYDDVHSFIAPEIAARECNLIKGTLYDMARAEANALVVALDAPPLDADGDGVNDAIDLCLGTISGQTVNVQGCSDPQLFGDDDDDGVSNIDDECPFTPPSEDANEEGCSDEQLNAIDSDGDGTPDYLDAYPRQGLDYCPIPQT